MNKPTKRENFTEIAEILRGLGNEELAEVMEHEIELLTRKNASKSKAQKEKEAQNAEYADAVLAVLEGFAEPTFVSEIIKAMPDAMTPENGWSSQKMTPILGRLVADKQVVKTIVKGRSVYALAE